MAHRGSRMKVVRIGEEPRQRFERARERIEHQGPRHGPGKPADERLDQLCDRVEPRSGRRRPLTSRAQGRIDDHGPRHHQRAAHALLEPPPWARDHGIAGRLGARAGSRRDRNDGQRPAGDRAGADSFEVIGHDRLEIDGRGQREITVGGQRGHGLGEVDRRPAPHRDDHCAGMAPRRHTGEGRRNLHDCRLAVRRGDHPVLDPRDSEARLEVGPRRRVEQASAAAHEPGTLAEKADDLADLRHPSDAEAHDRRQGEVVFQRLFRSRSLRLHGRRGHSGGAPAGTRCSTTL